MLRRGWTVAVASAALLSLLAASCGGGGGSSTSPPTQNPLPVLTSISPTSAVAGAPDFTLTVNGSSFISSSTVRWNGADRTTTFVSSTQLTAAISASDIAAAGSASVTVFNPTPGGGTSAAMTFTITAPTPIAILTSQLPDTTGGGDYSFTVAATGGVPPLTWSISAGALPGGLRVDPTAGQIVGTADAVANDTTYSFTLRAADSASTPDSATRTLSIVVHAAGNLGRNDACTAGTTAGTTPISNGTIRASISPYGDIDVYSFHGTAGKQVTIEIFAQRLDLDGDSSTRDSEMDSILELLDSTCPAAALNGNGTLAWNDDITSGTLQDSRIQDFTLPYTGLYFIRVRDFRGDGRPDLIYDLSLSGAD
jgi:hypothetical protein